MHLSEFKAWFLGFTEDMTKPPTEKQWKKIQARVKDITADYTPAPIFIDRYVRPYPAYPYWGDRWVTCGGFYPANSGYGVSNTTLANTAGAINAGGPPQVQLSDWSDAGRAEYRADLS